jgi:hypothetical protein
VTGNRYPAVAYDRDNEWDDLIRRDISQIDVARELAHSLAEGIPLRGGPLLSQREDGSVGPHDGSAVSIVWASSEYDDGTRRVLGWYETGR